MIKICVITGSRSEYGLLFPTLKKLVNDRQFKIYICVTGMHLSPEFGLTYKEIQNDGFKIDAKIESLLSSDTSVGISKSLGLGVIGFAEVYQKLKPDAIFILGDRYEIYAAAIAAMISRVPIIHCHGGELTEGCIDDAIRHSITKMSHLHFVSTFNYKKRVIQLGEDPKLVYNVGAFGIENINNLNLLKKNELENIINFKLDRNYFLVTFHPTTLEFKTSQNQFNELLKALNKFDDYIIVFTKPNADTDGRVIIKMIDDFVCFNKTRAISFTNLGQLNYLSALRHCKIVIGNSSSGIIESPTFKKVSINIGNRQKGRVMAESTINCNPNEIDIYNSIKKALSNNFQKKISKISNPYGSKNSSEKVLKILKKINFKKLLNKKFNNINYE